MGSVTEERYINEMLQMREEVLIKKAIYYFLLPAVLIGILAYLFPYVFAVIPTHFTQICACDYFYREKTEYYLLLDYKDDYLSLIFINEMMSSIYSFAYFAALLIMIYRIRHINDDTLVKQECFFIVTSWLFLSILTLSIFVS